MEFAVLYLIVWVVCGLISYKIAGGKNRNQIGWFFGGFFLGLIGILIVLLLPPLNKMEEEVHE